MTLLVATTNKDKVREIRRILAGLDLTLLTLDDVRPIAAPEETGRTFEENARLKAVAYATACDCLAVAEDSGLEIDALGGLPGIESARFGGERHVVSGEVPALIRRGRRGQQRALRVRAVAGARGS